MSRPVPGNGDVHGTDMFRLTGDDLERFIREARRRLTQCLNGTVEIDGMSAISIIQECDGVVRAVNDAERRAEIRAFNEGGGRRG